MTPFPVPIVGEEKDEEEKEEEEEEEEEEEDRQSSRLAPTQKLSLCKDLSLSFSMVHSQKRNPDSIM